MSSSIFQPSSQEVVDIINQRLTCLANIQIADRHWNYSSPTERLAHQHTWSSFQVVKAFLDDKSVARLQLIVLPSTESIMGNASMLVDAQIPSPTKRTLSCPKPPKHDQAQERSDYFAQQVLEHKASRQNVVVLDGRMRNIQ